jgi:hypothetical protein
MQYCIFQIAVDRIQSGLPWRPGKDPIEYEVPFVYGLLELINQSKGGIEIWHRMTNCYTQNAYPYAQRVYPSGQII